MNTKQEIRVKLKTIRNQIPENLRCYKSLQICDRICDLDLYRQSDSLFLYMPIQSEVDIRPVLERALEDGKKVYLPRTLGDDMNFYPCKSIESLIPGAFGVLEPEVSGERAPERGLMLVPGLGFDTNGYRMGYGKGYYDRYLAKHSSLITCGICFSDQMVEDLQPEAHDIPMNYLLTEEQIYNFS